MTIGVADGRRRGPSVFGIEQPARGVDTASEGSVVAPPIGAGDAVDVVTSMVRATKRDRAKPSAACYRLLAFIRKPWWSVLPWIASRRLLVCEVI
jgi:hypothetical protein